MEGYTPGAASLNSQLDSTFASYLHAFECEGERVWEWEGGGAGRKGGRECERVAGRVCELATPTPSFTDYIHDTNTVPQNGCWW